MTELQAIEEAERAAQEWKRKQAQLLEAAEVLREKLCQLSAVQAVERAREEA